MKCPYSLTLDKELVKECQKFLAEYGSKLSPVVNNLLRDWLYAQNKIKELKIKI